MIKTFVKIFVSLFFLLILVGFVAPQDAEAITIRVKNPYSHQLSVALVYYEDSSSRWVVSGWYNVTPNSTRDLNFNNSTKMQTVYIHAHTSEASWGSEMKYTVIKESFKYFAGEPCPTGNARRQVGFDKWYVENSGYVYWNP